MLKDQQDKAFLLELLISGDENKTSLVTLKWDLPMTRVRIAKGTNFQD